MMLVVVHAFHSCAFEVQRYKKYFAVPKFSLLNRTFLQSVKKRRLFLLIKNKVYAKVYDRYMLGTCSSTIYPR